MKAISIRQPWASLIASGDKTIETRTWPTDYRGPLLICASKNPRKGDLPTGVAICIVELVDCRPMTKEDEPAANCEIYPRAWSWVLKNRRTLAGGPFKVTGRLRLFNVELPGGVVPTAVEV